jgi:multisubunit Na+/H+ antiporter MnhE subunit
MKRPSIDKTKTGRLCTYAAVLFVLYLLYAGSFSYLEIAAAFCTALLSAFIITKTDRLRRKYRIRLFWFLPLLKRITVKWIIDTGIVLYTIWNYLYKGVPIHGELRRMPVRMGSNSNLARSRLALIMIFSTIPPNTVAIIPDQDNGRDIIVHQLFKSQETPGGGNLEWPL